MKCKEIMDKIDAYLEKELGKDELIEFEDHLRGCRNCQMELESIKKCINWMKNAFRAEKPPSEIKKMVFAKTCCGETEKEFCCPSENE